jgi:hypothetical protein
MKFQLTQIGHYILAIIFSGVYLVAVDHFLYNEAQVCLALGIFCVIIGIWGNKAKLVILRIPWGEKSYKIINCILVIIGVMLIFYGGYLFIRCDYSFAC